MSRIDHLEFFNRHGSWVWRKKRSLGRWKVGCVFGMWTKGVFSVAFFSLQLLLPTSLPKHTKNTSHIYNKETTHLWHVFVRTIQVEQTYVNILISQMGSLIDWNKDGSRRYSNETHDLNLPQKQVANVGRTSQVSIWSYALDPPKNHQRHFHKNDKNGVRNRFDMIELLALPKKGMTGPHKHTIQIPFTSGNIRLKDFSGSKFANKKTWIQYTWMKMMKIISGILRDPQ